jgi:hypothetical protein
MSKPDVVEVEVLKLILANQAVPNVGDAPGLQPSAAAGSVYLALHFSDPGESGDQTTFECAYGGYARQALTRALANWTFGSDGSAALAADKAFPNPTTYGGRVLYWSVGTSLSGAGKILYKAPLVGPVELTVGSTPTIAAGSKVSED